MWIIVLQRRFWRGADHSGSRSRDRQAKHGAVDQETFWVRSHAHQLAHVCQQGCRTIVCPTPLLSVCYFKTMAMATIKMVANKRVVSIGMTSSFSRVDLGPYRHPERLDEGPVSQTRRLLQELFAM